MDSRFILNIMPERSGIVKVVRVFVEREQGCRSRSLRRMSDILSHRSAVGGARTRTDRDLLEKLPTVHPLERRACLPVPPRRQGRSALFEPWPDDHALRLNLGGVAIGGSCSPVAPGGSKDR